MENADNAPKKEIIYAIAETGAYLAIINGLNIFRLNRHDGMQWEFVIPTSPQWNFYHQAVFYAGRADRITEKELPEGTPAIPEIPKGPFPSRESFYNKEEVFGEDKYPRVYRLLYESENNELDLKVVLSEDLWESSFGDGIFLEFYSVYLDLDSANKVIAKNDNAVNYELCELKLKLINNEIRFVDYELGTFEEYSMKQVISRLERKLRKKVQSDPPVK